MHICLDFDGVCTTGESGGTPIHQCVDPPVVGLFKFVENAIRQGFIVSIFSWRSGDPRGIEAMRLWFLMHGFTPDILEFPSTKPPASVFVDPKSFRFQGDWPSLKELKLLKVWYKKL